jgi:hypothetical protein
MLVCAASGHVATRKSAAAAQWILYDFIACSFYGVDVEIVQPFTVTVLAEVEPGPPDVEDELDTPPPPA